MSLMTMTITKVIPNKLIWDDEKHKGIFIYLNINMENISYDDMSEPLCCNQARQELTLREHMILKYLNFIFLVILTQSGEES